MTARRMVWYWRQWGRVARANGWRMCGGRLADEARGPECGEHHQAVWEAAEALARGRHRAVTVEDLRHGCHVRALRRNRSSRDLTNRDLDRVLVLFRLLMDPDDVEAVMAWGDPGVGDERRLDWFLGHAAPEAYVRAVSGDKFGTRQWERLGLEAKRQLALTLRHRKAAWQRPVAVAEAAVSADCPF